MEKLLILYGEQNVGKTSTLRKVFEILTGHKLNSHDPKKDMRVVLTVGNKTIFMSTFGDSATAISQNFNFFNRKMRSTMIVYELGGGKLKKKTKADLSRLPAPDICITACRIYKSGTPNDIFDKLNESILDIMPIKDIHWIAKTEAKENEEIQKTLETALNITAEIIINKIV